jgi:molybdopterin molybdotransferase
MVSVAEASSIILAHPFDPSKENVQLIQATGRFLAEQIKADRDLPPFDRVTMDGIALRSSEFQQGTRSFRVGGIQPAGHPRLKLPDSTSCIEVMTGAWVPEGADTVVRYEDIESKDGLARINLETVTKGENIHVRGADSRENDVLLAPGMKITPAEVALMASVGKSEVGVYTLPKTAIISTGDELVPVDQTPLPHQIRQSNGHGLHAALNELKGKPSVFLLPDRQDALKYELAEILSTHALIILSGGVSKGKFDYVPEVLESLGIKKLFHQVSQKPGKPFWFGRGKSQTVFALPGNPVSTYMCFYRYILPWIVKSFGIEEVFPSATLASDFSFKPALTYFLQVKTRNENGSILAYPVPGGGSGDFVNLKEVNGFLELPSDKTDFTRGEVFPFIPFRP